MTTRTYWGGHAPHLTQTPPACFAPVNLPPFPPPSNLLLLAPPFLPSLQNDVAKVQTLIRRMTGPRRVELDVRAPDDLHPLPYAGATPLYVAASLEVDAKVGDVAGADRAAGDVAGGVDAEVRKAGGVDDGVREEGVDDSGRSEAEVETTGGTDAPGADPSTQGVSTEGDEASAVSILDLLLEAGVDVNKPNRRGEVRRWSVMGWCAWPVVVTMMELAMVLV